MHISQATKCNIETQHALNNSYTSDILLSVNNCLGVITIVRFKMVLLCGRESHQSQSDKFEMCIAVSSNTTRELAYNTFGHI